MMQYIVTMTDGSVGIMHILDDSSPEECIAKWHTDQIAKVAKWREKNCDLPTYLFRDAWVDDGQSIAVDMPKARQIHKQRLRNLREPLLKALDVEYIKALESSDQKSMDSVAAKKQALRDIPGDPRIDQAKTPEQLAEAIPQILLLP